MRVIRTYYIVERRVNIAGFKGKKETTFTELGRNYTSQWLSKRSLKICTRSTEPLQILDNKSLYRIRFTQATNDPIDIEILFKSNTVVTVRK